MIPESSMALSPASIPSSRNDLSHSSPNCVSPIPITATSRILGGLSHPNLPAVLRVRRVVQVDFVAHHFRHRPAGLLELLDVIRHGEIEPVAPRAAPVADREDSVPWPRDVEDRTHPDHDRGAVRVPDVSHEEARVDLLLREPEHLPDPLGELPVRLVEDGVVVVPRLRSRLLEQELGAAHHVLEVRGFAREPPAMARVSLALPPPEVGGVCR